MRVVLAAGATGEPQTLEWNLEAEFRREVLKEATAELVGLSLVQNVLQERLNQTSAADKLCIGFQLFL